MKLDMHGHTYWSRDSQLALVDLEDAILRSGLDAVCITDHNEIGGALELAARGKVRVIPGEEVYTTEGEIIGLFLKEKIPARLSPQETITAIHEQGGIVYIPHPLDRFRGSRLQPAALAAVLEQADVFEVFNARNLLTGDNTRALQMAQRRSLRLGAGSDSHTSYEVGHAYVEIPEFQTAAELLTALESAVIHGRRTNPLIHVRTRIDKTLKRRAAPVWGPRRSLESGYIMPGGGLEPP